MVSSKIQGPGRFSKHIMSYFGSKQQLKDSHLLPINAFGSNQSHSNSFKSDNPFAVDRSDVYLTHMFAGTWRGNNERKKIILLSREDAPTVSHNITIHKTQGGYRGVARYDEDTSRTKFMKQLGACTQLVEYNFDTTLKLQTKKIKQIQEADQSHKFEDYRAFKYQGKTYFCTAYIDTDFNTYMGVLDSNYNFLGKINIEKYHKMAFVSNKEVYWEKNWLFFEHETELYFVYSTTPSLIIYKCYDFDKLIFKEHINTINNLSSLLPRDQLYFSSNTTTGGSTNPIYIEKHDCYVYLIHTKIYSERKYNHYAVGFDKNFKIKFLNAVPFINSYVGYSLMFITTMIEDGNYLIISGGIEDNQNFLWEIPIDRLKIS